MKIHPEGYKIILVTVLMISIINGFLYVIMENAHLVRILSGSISFIFLVMVLQFFRNPFRIIPYNEKHLIAPADGKIVVIEEVEEDEYYKEKRLQVSIFMSPFNVHVNRYPFSGFIKYMKYHPGQFLVAWNPKSSTENERNSVVIENANGVSILLRQIAGALAKRIIYNPILGNYVKQGAELGIIKFGSRVDMFLPIGTKINVELNQEVRGGQTVIAHFNLT